jgi:hypothetical protein
MAARLTAEERASLKALSDRAAAEDDEDSGLEIWAEKDGHRALLKGADARRYRSRFGLDDDDEPDDQTEPDPKAKGGGGYLKRKTTPPAP